MRKRAMLLIVGVVVFFAGMAVAGEKLIIPARSEVVIRGFSAGDEIAKLTEDVNAKMVMRFVRESSYLGVPVPHKNGRAVKIVQNPGKRDYYLCVVPLLSSDKGVSKDWEEAYDSEMVALYVPDRKRPQLIMRDQSQFSKNWQGLMLIHEGSHALAFSARAFEEIKDPLMKRSINELYAYNLEINLVEKIGGLAYKELIQEEVGRLKGDYLEQQRVLFPDYARYQERLEKIFGESNSELEVGVRSTLFWLNAAFRLFDETCASKDESGMRKADLLYGLYEGGNIR